MSSNAFRGRPRYVSWSANRAARTRPLRAREQPDDGPEPDGKDDDVDEPGEDRTPYGSSEVTRSTERVAVVAIPLPLLHAALVVPDDAAGDDSSIVAPADPGWHWAE